MTNFQVSIHFFLQLCVILVACRVMGWLGKKFLGQPQVVSEMIAGVVLGPSVFGTLFPDLFASFFPKHSLTVIYCASQVGLVLYMFVIGAEFRTDIVVKRLRTAAVVSGSGILAPFLVAGVLAAFLVPGAPFFADGVTFGQRWLFLGAAISITAFPMLARIIHETGIGATSTGAIALAAGSLDDAAAWCILAVVLATFSGDGMIAAKAVGGGALYALAVLGLLRPLLRRLFRDLETRQPSAAPWEPGEVAFSSILVLLMLAAYVTDAVGIYAVFGAFILGAAMPKGPLTRALQSRIEPLTVAIFLPLFFVYSGLNTKISLLLQGSGLFVAAVILLGSILAKFAACMASAWAGGETLRGAACIGVLMNARGLMELILLNIGLERGLITESLFTALVLMAIITTLMATPVFNRIYKREPPESVAKLASALERAP